MQVSNHDRIKLANLQQKIWKDLLAKKVTDPHTAKSIAKLLDNVTQIEVGAFKGHTTEEIK